MLGIITPEQLVAVGVVYGVVGTLAALVVMVGVAFAVSAWLAWR